MPYLLILALTAIAGVLLAYDRGVRRGYEMGYHAQTGRMPSMQSEADRKAAMRKVELAIQADERRPRHNRSARPGGAGPAIAEVGSIDRKPGEPDYVGPAE